MVTLKLLATHPECIYFLFELSLYNFLHTGIVELQERFINTDHGAGKLFYKQVKRDLFFHN